MRNKATKQKSKKKGTDNAFGCDLIEHLQNTGQDVPRVLRKCAEFIEKHGIVDGIYRLSGVTSNIQRLRQEFCSDACPDLTKEVYLQDIHCVGSLCKLYFRELPNPLLTYELYTKFTEAVQGDHDKLSHIQKVVKELPTAHFRTLEYLTKHLARLATLSTKTNMHTRNLALVWAPNLLRSKDIEVSSGNGDMAFQEVRVQQSVIEFILNHSEQIFSSSSVQIKREGLMCGEKYATLPISGPSGPMKLMSLEEAQARSLSPNHPVHKERQRENSLPDASTAQLYHTVIDIDSKRKFSGKSKKWKSIFNLGRSVDSKGKLSRNGSVFIRAQGITEKAKSRKSRSMESLCSLPTDEERMGGSVAAGPGCIFAPDVKSRTLGSDSLFDLSEDEATWEIKGIRPSGATAGWAAHMDRDSVLGTSLPTQRTLPEQLKVFKGEDLRGFQPTSPKSRRMLYSSRPSFSGSFFPLESSPRHQRRALNISEPFAVSVPLRVSAVISSNSTPCRSLAKDKAAALKIPELGTTRKNNTVSQPETKKHQESDKIRKEEGSSIQSDDLRYDGSQESQKSAQSFESEDSFSVNAQTAPSSGEDLHNPSTPQKLEKVPSIGKGHFPGLRRELKISEPEINLLDATFKPVFGTQKSYDGLKLTHDVKSKKSQSSPSLTLLCKEMSLPSMNHEKTGSESAKKQTSESDIQLSLHKGFNVVLGGSTEKIQLSTMTNKEEKPNQSSPKTEPGDNSITQNLASSPKDDTLCQKSVDIPETHPHKNNISHDSRKNLVLELDGVPRLSICLEERKSILELEDEDAHGEELDLVEPWEDFNSAKQWVTSPLHSPDVEVLFKQFASSESEGNTKVAKETNTSQALSDNSKSSTKPSLTKTHSGNMSTSSKPEAKWIYVPSRMSTTSHTHKSNIGKHKTPASSQRFHRQMSHEAAALDRKEEKASARHRPYSLNLDLGSRCIRDISHQQNLGSTELCKKGLQPGSVHSCLSELDLFLNDNQAPLRRNSAPVSVSSVRTAFMIKTCQAKAVPVIPPKVQYSQIPHSRLEKESATEEEKECTKTLEKNNAPVMSELKEELENKEPEPKTVKAAHVEKTVEPAAELPVITRRHAPSLEVFVDAPRTNKSNILQRSSFRNRQRPQSLILLSPPFPIMDYPSSGDDGKLLSSIKSLNDTMSESCRVSEQVQNTMTIPKSGQRLETSTSCFYQPQRRSMIFDSRNHRQNE